MKLWLSRPQALLTAVVALLVMLSLDVRPAPAAQTVFINEFHYDNVGVDQDEAVEVAGPAATDLAGYSLELDNGFDGAPYATIALSGVIPDQDNGYGTVSFAVSPLQNGAPDGIVLNGPSGGPAEMLGYEGTFTATGGSALGSQLTDIGRFEAPSTPVGRSIQRQGTGRSASDFVWRGPLGATPGRVNTAQHFTATSSPAAATGSTPAAATGSTPAAATGSTPRTCVSRRRFAIHLRRPDGTKIASARVVVNGKRVGTGQARRAIVDLRGLPQGTYRARIVIRTTSGRTIRTTRRYRTCASSRD